MSDIEKVKQLRQITGAGFKDCNLALKETDGNIEKSVEVLRVKGISKASKKMGRDAREGLIAVSSEKNKISIIEVNCETDFVAKNNDFKAFVKELSIINNNCNSNKEKLLVSKMNNNKTVNENLIDLISKIGEKITIGRLKSMISDKKEKNYSYLHTIVESNLSKLAAIVKISSDEDNEKINEFGKQLSMHIAASNPLSIRENEIDLKILNKEKELITEELKNTKKPSEIIEKISLGKLNKFKQDNSLLTQDWVMSPDKKVKDIISELNFKNLKIDEFYRVKIGD